MYMYVCTSFGNLILVSYPGSTSIAGILLQCLQVFHGSRSHIYGETCYTCGSGGLHSNSDNIHVKMYVLVK